MQRSRALERRLDEFERLLRLRLKVQGGNDALSDIEREIVREQVKMQQKTKTN